MHTQFSVLDDSRQILPVALERPTSIDLIIQQVTEQHSGKEVVNEDVLVPTS